MLHLDRLGRELGSCREAFHSYGRTRREDAARYGARLLKLTQQTADEIKHRTAAERAPGSLPSDELDLRHNISVPFPQRWRSHEEARRWALDVLRERTTFAADGSQIMPGRDISVPVAVVQVAHFENHHRRGGEYVKDATLKVIAPDELLEHDAASTGAYVSFRRFALEVEAIESFMRRHEGWEARGARMPLAFLDGTLQLTVGSNAGDDDDANSSQLPRTVEDYIHTLKRLVELSRQTRVPVVGYIDHSLARDIIVLLNTIAGEARRKPSKLFDAQLLEAGAPDGTPMLDGWGTRTIFFHCLRRGLVDFFVDEEKRPLVGFSYMRTVTDAAPARLDIPAWVHQAGLLDEVADAVRAECVVGNGYPYPIETADAAAALSPADREQFLRLIGEFSRTEHLDFHVARKRMSKSQRR